MDEMKMRRAIERKRDGEALEPQLWEAVVAAFVEGGVDDAQMAAMAMACLWRGLNLEETAALTGAMVRSGRTLEYSPGAVVLDKHSSGGVSDIVSLVAVPLVAACGVRVAKLSGRALGHTGGTIDKLETIPGFNVSLSMEAFVAQVEGVGCAIAAQTDSIVPADKRLYRLRDRTATVPSMGLIAASIVSKKIAGGADAFVFDVKCGSGAFMRDPERAAELARMLVHLAHRFGRKARAVVSDMNEPLGLSVGPALEVIEARDVLRGAETDARIREGCLQVAEAMLDLAGIEKPRTAAVSALDGGGAYEKFIAMIEAQGSSRAALEAMRPHPQRHPVRAACDGFVTGIDAVCLGNLAREAAQTHENAGILLSVRVGRRVERGAILAEVCGSHVGVHHVEQAISIGSTAPVPRPLVYAAI